jgi:ketosteroid isomerase-like protein
VSKTADLVTLAYRKDSERPGFRLAHDVVHEFAITGLENMQREWHPREQDRAQREQGNHEDKGLASALPSTSGGSAMAEHPNVELLRSGYNAYSTGDMDVLTRLFADEILWHVAGRSPISGDYKGRDQVFGFFGKLMELSDGTAKIDVHDILANDEHGVALVTGTATRGGRSFEGQDVHTFHIRNGQVVEFWDGPLDQYEADEFWS